jgi:hypothetical protein
MRGCLKRATCNVNQMGIFWYFFILTSYVGNFLNQGCLKRVLLYKEQSFELGIGAGSSAGKFGVLRHDTMISQRLFLLS